MATSLFNLNNLNGNNGFRIPGTTQDDRLGTKVDLTGDINGDGIDDLIVSSIDGGNPSNSPYSYQQSDRRGETYVIFGTRNGFNSSFNLANLNGSNGFIVRGIDPDNNLGSAISLGDVNGDGIDDLALGAPYGGGKLTSYGEEYSVGDGRAYIIFGKRDGFTASIDLASLNANNGLTLGGIDFQDNLGTSITSAGDINGDGIDDLAVSAANAGKTITNNNGYSYSDRRGEAFIVFGSRNFNSPPNLAQLNGSNGFKIEGKAAYNNLSDDLSNAGDINGDGIDDLIIGTSAAGDVLDSPYANGDSDRRGESYVIFGSRNGFNSQLNLNSLNGSNGFTIGGINPEDRLGNAVNNAGDINGDGIDDLILGAKTANQTGEYTAEGGVYVIFGKNNNFAPQFDLSNLNGSNGFAIPGLNLDDNLGNAVAAGDINGDGIDDLIFGANTAGQTIQGFEGYNYSDRRGETYILYGKNKGFAAEINLDSLNSADGGKIAGVGTEDLLGSAISSGGDINGDGIDDFVTSAPGVDIGGEYTKEGEVYVVFGQKDVTLLGINGTNGPDKINGTSNGDLISGLGGNDIINGKGGNDTLRGNENDDFLVGEFGDDVLFGDDGSDRLNGQAGNDTLDGGNGNDTLMGGINDDSLNGNADNDKIYGQAGNDTLNGGNGNDILNGNDGFDLLNGNDGNDSLNGLAGRDTLFGNDGDDILSGGSSQDLLYGGSGMDRMNGNNNADELYGNDGNDTLNGGNGNDTLNGNRGNDILNGNEDNDVLDGTKFKDENFGLNERDTLIGGTGRDIFTLGNDGRVYYDDKISASKGISDFAVIKDLEVGEDTVKLMGRVEQYSLNFYRNGSGNFNAEIVYNPGNYLLGELIGVLEDVPSNLNITDPVFNII
ncbi:FG-GAP repeat protein [Waterburya agarophytonicola K14]|uniref:FG-GAP repeat protein n=1 Tax=Waterburya agarophytonicola KI4 TaxID=2874699 RepID=A0A964BRX5_9CYAN|nr:calcium-binding protein [Waterburya agarophytonicola]MCC0177667.1 FG-GAP repeat protein [Waterburya agarophytonicola KI4]